MDYGLNAFFIRLFWNDIELSQFVEDFRYSASEEEDDECQVRIKSDDRNIPDMQPFQEGAELKIAWGFIGTTQITTRIIQVVDPQWQYDRDNIVGTIVCTEKGSKIKLSSSDGVYRNTSLLGVAGEVADKHGLTLKVELPSKEDKNTKPINADQALGNLIDLGEKISMAGGVAKYLEVAPMQIIGNKDLLREMEKFAAARREIDSIAKSMYGKTYTQIKDEFGPGGDQTHTGSLESIQRSISFAKFLKDMKNYPFLPQGNKTDKQMLTDMGMRETDGPFIAETRDNDLIIRRRNWNKKPYRAYEFGGPEGTFIEWASDPKNRTRRGSSTNLGFGTWDELNKRYMEGNANAVNDTTRSTVAKYEQLVENYKVLVEKYPDAIVGYKEVTKEIGSNKGFLSPNIIGSSALSDETRVLKSIRIPLYAIDKLKILEETLNQVKGITPNKKVNDPANDTIEDAYDQASNLRNNSELKRNPMTAKFYGDVGLWPGEILTLSGLGNKYSGNYYITKADHAGSKSAGYICSVELARKGTNIKTNEDSVSTKALGKTFNNQVGPDKGQGEKKSISITENLR